MKMLVFSHFSWYTVHMTEQEIQFIRSRPHLVWYVKDYEHLSEESLVEHVLNYGTWKDVQELIRVMGMTRMAGIFRERAFLKRSSYRPEISRYFDLYFKRYVP